MFIANIIKILNIAIKKIKYEYLRIICYKKGSNNTWILKMIDNWRNRWNIELDVVGEKDIYRWTKQSSELSSEWFDVWNTTMTINIKLSATKINYMGTEMKMKEM